MLVHCSQGVSRSAALAIAFLMWQSQRPYEQVFAEVKAIRGIANPNIGFTCQAGSSSVIGFDQRVQCLKCREVVQVLPGTAVPDLAYFGMGKAMWGPKDAV